jgi:hypothetical protein
LIEDWTPEPLVSDVPADHRALNPRVVTGKVNIIMLIHDLMGVFLFIGMNWSAVNKQFELFQYHFVDLLLDNSTMNHF